MQVVFVTDEGGECPALDSDHYGLPRRGDDISWEMNMPKQSGIPNGPYTVTAVEWRISAVARVIVYMTKRP